MVTQALLLVLNAVFDLFILAALVRFWMQAFRAPVFNPLGQFTIALTDWGVKPLRRVIPGPSSSTGRRSCSRAPSSSCSKSCRCS